MPGKHLPVSRTPRQQEPEDLIDGDITSQQTLDEAPKDGSAISKRWRIVTDFQVDDFVRALEAAR